MVVPIISWDGAASSATGRVLQSVRCLAFPGEILATATIMKNSKSNRISRLENLPAAAIVFVLWVHRMPSQGDCQPPCLLNNCDSCECRNHGYARLMVMGLVGFLGVSYPRYPLLHPTYFHTPPLPSLWLNTFECVPMGRTSIGAPHRGYPHRDTRKTTVNRGTHRGYPKAPNIPGVICPPPQFVDPPQG